MATRTVSWTVVFLLFYCLFTFTPTEAASKEEWTSRSIYQIVTDRFARSDNSTTASCNPANGEYCGGTFRGIINKLDYVQDMGFSAIWISPVTYPIQGTTKDHSAYHGYWQQDLYRINPDFGTPDDLRALSKELHSRGMFLMVDVVVNNLAWPGNHTTVDYSQFNPFNNSDYFHPFRLVSDDPQNETCVQDCWLGDETVSLPDLRTEDHEVMTKLYSWIKELVLNYTLDGLSVDSVSNIDRQFWQGFSEAAGVFCLGDGNSDNASTLCPLQWNLDGLLNYPIYSNLTGTFNNTDTSMNGLLDQMANVRLHCDDIFSLGTFTENQDVPRFASYTKDISLASNIITYNILGDGIPILYYGEEQHLDGSYNPVNREALWKTKYKNSSTPLPDLVQTLNRLRSHAAGNGAQYTEEPVESRDYVGYISQAVYNTSHAIAIRKGYAGNQVITVLSNLGSHPSRDSGKTLTLRAGGTGFHAGQNVTEIISCKVVTTDSTGNVQVNLNDGGPQVYYPSNSLNHSRLCGYGSSDKKSEATTSLVFARRYLALLVAGFVVVFVMV